MVSKQEFLAKNGDMASQNQTRLSEIQEYDSWIKFISEQPKFVRVVACYLALLQSKDRYIYESYVKSVAVWIENPCEETYKKFRNEFTVVDEIFNDWCFHHPGKGSIHYHLYYSGFAIRDDQPWDSIHVINALADEFYRINGMSEANAKNEIMKRLKAGLVEWYSEREFPEGE